MVGEVSAGSSLIEPKLPPATIAGTVEVFAPVHVVDMSPWAGPDEPGGHDWPAVKATPIVE
jgi:hypothetical protein